MNLVIQGVARALVDTDKSKHYRLFEDDLLSLPRSCTGIRVESGCVWMTWDGRDVILHQREEFQLTPGHDHALITALYSPSTISVALR